MKKIVTFMWYSNGIFQYVLKAEFVTLISLKVPLGNPTYYRRSSFFFIFVSHFYLKWFVHAN